MHDNIIRYINTANNFFFDRYYTCIYNIIMYTHNYNIPYKQQPEQKPVLMSEVLLIILLCHKLNASENSSQLTSTKIIILHRLVTSLSRELHPPLCSNCIHKSQLDRLAGNSLPSLEDSLHFSLKVLSVQPTSLKSTVDRGGFLELHNLLGQL